jgi:hypothetical protein
MSYNKEIKFLNDNSYKILDCPIAVFTELEGGYETADLKFSSVIVESSYELTTNVGILDFTTCSIKTKFYQHDGETNSWDYEKDKDKIQLSLKTWHVSHDIDHDKTIEFLSKLEEVGSIYKVKDFNLIENTMRGHKSEDKVILTRTSLPSIILDALIEKNPDKFLGVNIKKLKDLNDALNNTSIPNVLLEKLSLSSESAQAGIVHYATKKSKDDVDRLLNKQYSPESESMASY